MTDTMNSLLNELYDMNTLQDRVNELFNESDKAPADFIDYCKRRGHKITKATVSAWRTGQTKTIKGDNAIYLADFFGTNIAWVQNGTGPKLPPKHTGDDEKLKLIEIIEAADRAMRDSGREFTESERLDNYFAALEFAGRQYFPTNFVSQYVEELLKSKDRTTKK